MKITNILNPNNTLSVNRPLAHAIGVNAAIVFASLIAKQAYYEENQMLDESGFFYSTIEDLEESTALSFNKQKKALDLLAEVGLIEYRVKGTPAKRYFKIIDNDTLLVQLLDLGALACKNLDNSKTSFQENNNLVFEKSENKFLEKPKTSFQKIKNSIYKTKVNQSKENQSKVINPKSSIIPPQETKEMTDLTEELTEGVTEGMTEGMNDFHEENYFFENERSEREEYLDTIHENIEYDSISEKERADEVVGVMLDVMCSQKGTVRVNGEELPAEQVRRRFLELKKAHIEHVLGALESNAGSVRNIRAYLITALYNAPTAVYSACSSPNNASPNGSYSSNNSARSSPSAPEKRSRTMESSFDADEVLARIKERYKRPREEDAWHDEEQ